MIEMNQIVCFLTILEENSFSKAAETLGIAQSAVSQKLRRLEDQLGIHLLERTSRRMRLSPQGHEFLPFAQQMMEAEERARTMARQLAEQARNTIKLGGYAFASYLRTQLVSGYLARYPAGRIEVEYGTREALLAMLRQGKIDAFLCIEGSAGPLDEFDYVYYRRLDGYIALPPDHDLARRDIVQPNEFAGMRLVISPGRQDAPVLNPLCRMLSFHGADLVFAPEAERSSLAQFARQLALPSLRWLTPGTPPYDERGYRVVPVEGGLTHLDHYIYARKGLHTPLIERFLRFAHETTDGFGSAGAEHARG
ncbi:MAG: LysR family transcriptional regulator [Novosphingobium sp.]|nr:LysR family transcriptional regulator [Novosphingobium sp.]